MIPLHILQGLVFAKVLEKTSSNDSQGSSVTILYLNKKYALHLLIFSVQVTLKNLHYLDFLEEFLDYWKPCSTQRFVRGGAI